MLLSHDAARLQRRLRRCRAERVLRATCLYSAQPDSATPAPWRSAHLCAAGLLAAAALVLPASAISENQLLFLEAWRAVDRAYVDKSFNGQAWFRYRETTVKNAAMDTREETYSAIRTMLATLARARYASPHQPLIRAARPQNDPFTRFLTPEQLEALQGATSGSLTGVGLELAPAAGGSGVVRSLLLATLCSLTARSWWSRPRPAAPRSGRGSPRAAACCLWTARRWTSCPCTRRLHCYRARLAGACAARLGD